MGYCQSHVAPAVQEAGRCTRLAGLAYVSLGTCLVVFASRGTALALPTNSLELSVTFIVNKADGRTESCESFVPVARYRKQEWWLSLDAPRPHAKRNRDGVDVGITCGRGALKTSPPGAEAAAGTPS